MLDEVALSVSHETCMHVKLADAPDNEPSGLAAQLLVPSQRDAFEMAQVLRPHVAVVTYGHTDIVYQKKKVS